MAHLKDLDEYTDEQLQGELNHRRKDRSEGKCDYCHRRYDTKPCRFPARHAIAGEHFHNGWKWVLQYSNNYLSAESECGKWSANVSRYGSDGAVFEKPSGLFSSSTCVGEILVPDEGNDGERVRALVDLAIEAIGLRLTKRKKETEGGVY
jgi:hypothetical protein